MLYDMELAKILEHIIEGEDANAIRAVEDLIVENLTDALGEHCYPKNWEKDGLWWCHSFMSEQEYALKKLISMGVFEYHPENKSWFRPVDKNHVWYGVIINEQ